MTDARIPERFLADRRILLLTDQERSSYFMATLYTVANRTDGRITKVDLPLIPTFQPTVIPTLVKAGLWTTVTDGWLDTEFVRNQTSRDDLEVLENARRVDREKKARQRAHKVDDHSRCTPNTCTVLGTVPGTSPGDSTGQDRTETGQDRPKNSRGSQNTPEALDWPTRKPGEGRPAA